MLTAWHSSDATGVTQVTDSVIITDWGYLPQPEGTDSGIVCNSTPGVDLYFTAGSSTWREFHGLSIPCPGGFYWDSDHDSYVTYELANSPAAATHDALAYAAQGLVLAVDFAFIVLIGWVVFRLLKRWN